MTSVDIYYRVLLASIRDKGKCPCPGCLLPKDKIPGLGSASDRRTRKTKAREYNDQHRRNVETARKIIYEDGYAVTSKTLDPFLARESLVATDVSLNLFSLLLHS